MHSIIDIIETTSNCGKKQQLVAQPKSNKPNQEKGGDGRQREIRQYFAQRLAEKETGLVMALGEAGRVIGGDPA